MNIQYIPGANNNIDKLFTNIKSNNPDIYLSIGGDGTVIRTFKQMVKDGYNVPVLVLAGGTINFLSNNVKNNFKETIDMLKQNKLKFYEYKFKPIEVTFKDKTYLAINDILIGNNIIDFNTITINAQSPSLENVTFQGAGLNISTEIGSTGFHMNNGGQVFFDNHLFGITSIVSNKHINEVIPTQYIEISVHNQRTNINVYIDGSTTILNLEHYGKISIKQSNKYYTLAFLKKNQLKNKKIQYLDTNRLRY